MDGVMHIELPQNYAALLRRLHKETKLEPWRLVVQAIDRVYGEPNEMTREELLEAFGLFKEEK